MFDGWLQETLGLPVNPNDTMWLDIVVLLAMLLFLRIITYYVLRVRTEDKGAISSTPKKINWKSAGNLLSRFVFVCQVSIIANNIGRGFSACKAYIMVCIVPDISCRVCTSSMLLLCDVWLHVFLSLRLVCNVVSNKPNTPISIVLHRHRHRAFTSSPCKNSRCLCEFRKYCTAYNTSRLSQDRKQAAQSAVAIMRGVWLLVFVHLWVRTHSSDGFGHWHAKMFQQQHWYFKITS